MSERFHQWIPTANKAFNVFTELQSTFPALHLDMCFIIITPIIILHGFVINYKLSITPTRLQLDMTSTPRCQNEAGRGKMSYHRGGPKRKGLGSRDCFSRKAQDGVGLPKPRSRDSYREKQSLFHNRGIKTLQETTWWKS